MTISLGIWKRFFLALAFVGIVTAGGLLYALHGVFLRVHTNDMEFIAAFSLVDELRNNIRSLNALAHRATASAYDADAEQNFRHILNIQSGIVPRPSTVHVAPGLAVPLVQLAEQARLAPDEMDILRQAYTVSAELASIELQAIRLAAHIDIDDMVGAKARETVRTAVELVTSSQYVAKQRALENTLSDLLHRIRERLTAEGDAMHDQIHFLVVGLCLMIFLVLGSLIVAGHLTGPSGKVGARRNRRVCTAIVALLVLALLAPLALVYNNARNLLILALEKRQTLICNEVYNELHQRSNQTLELIRIAASMPSIRSFITDGAVNPGMSSLYQRVKDILFAFNTGYTDSAYILLFNSHGQMMTNTMEGVSQQWQLLPEPVLQRALSGEAFITTLAVSSDDYDELAVVVPVFAHDVQSKGDRAVVGIMMSLLDRRNSLRIWEGRLAAEEQMHIFIVNKTGEVILSSRHTIGESGHNVASQMAYEGATGLHYYTNAQGMERMGYFRQVPELGWTIVVSSSLNSLTGDVRTMLVQAGLFSTVAILCVLLLSAQLILRITTNLRVSNESMANLIANSGMFKWDLNIPADVFRFDAQFLHILDFPNTDEGEWTLKEHLARYHPDNTKDIITAGILEGGYTAFERRYRAYDGQWKWLKIFARVDKVDKLGQPILLSGTGADITAEKQEAISTAEQKCQLEEIVAQRTIELQESRDHAQAASQAKSAFLSTVSHEIRTPMNAIVGFVHIFDRNNLSSTQKNYLDKIRLSAATLLGVINDVLDVSKIEAGKLELENIPFRIHGLLDTVCSIVGYAADEKDLTITVDVTPDVPDVLMGDPKRIGQVLLNLMNNAVKFTSEGGIILHVALDENSPIPEIFDNVQGDEAPENQAPETPWVMLSISVEDSGIGLSNEQAGRLFKPFMQADNTVTRRFGGTGLGLAISRHLVELMGGTIGVTSQEGRGSVFYFTLRLDLCSADAMHTLLNEHRQEDNAALATRPSFANKAVLVVEDNDINQEIATALLAEYDIAPDIADNGQIGLNMAATKRYDCIFMDLQMPVMGGLEATRRIRALGKEDHALWLASVPIIAMTANAMDEDRQRCIDAGMDDHIGKPIDPATLGQRLVRWLA